MSKKYCYRTPSFPPEAYIGLTFIENREGHQLLYPLSQIYLDIKSTHKSIVNLKKELQDEQKATIFSAMILKIKFHKTFPLRAEHWTYAPDADRFNSFTRGTYYLKMLNDVRQFYQIIVLPNHYNVKKNKWDFVNWIPILITAATDYIDGLIMDSDQGVEISADSMGFYIIESIRGLDIETGLLIEPTLAATKTEFNC